MSFSPFLKVGQLGLHCDLFFGTAGFGTAGTNYAISIDHVREDADVKDYLDGVSPYSLPSKNFNLGAWAPTSRRVIRAELRVLYRI